MDRKCYVVQTVYVVKEANFEADDVLRHGRVMGTFVEHAAAVAFGDDLSAVGRVPLYVENETFDAFDLYEPSMRRIE